MALWFACRHPATPRAAKWLAIATAAYAFSPIDLLPDFIPVIGLLDDLIILPLMIYLTVRLLPPRVLEECRARADEWIASRREKPRSRGGALAVGVIWAAALSLAVWAYLV
jgi:uncharacterized membrane protein YkvA (DUF1232 family)